MKYDYSNVEIEKRDAVLSVKDKLIHDMQLFRQMLEFTNLQMRNVERYEAGLMAEMLFRRDIPLDKMPEVDWGSECMEVHSDQPE